MGLLLLTAWASTGAGRLALQATISSYPRFLFSSLYPNLSVRFITYAPKYISITFLFLHLYYSFPVLGTISSFLSLKQLPNRSPSSHLGTIEGHSSPSRKVIFLEGKWGCITPCLDPVRASPDLTVKSIACPSRAARLGF